MQVADWAAGLAVAVSVVTARFTRFDAAVMDHLVSRRSPQLSPLLHGIYTLGDEVFAGVVVLAALAVLAWARRWRDAMGFAAATGGIVVWVDVVLKPLFDRHRPLELMVSTTGTSFPSGHAAGNLVLYLYLSVLLAERHAAAGAWSTRLAWTWVLLQGFASVYLGAHYPSDILAGIGVGFLWLAIVLTWRKPV